MEVATSYVIIEIATGSAVLETFSEKIAQAINTNKYKAVPILEYLQAINKEIKTR